MNDISDLLPNSGTAGRLLIYGADWRPLCFCWLLNRLARKALRQQIGADSPPCHETMS